jgi:tRNA dimethylallyltransferase
MTEEEPRILVICGATATGKTDLAFNWAKRLQTEIVSFDSVQVYKRFDIGTAKPSKFMMKEVKHYFIDEVEPDEIFSAGDFRRKAMPLIDNLVKSRGTAVLVGGTGFYLQALLKGMYEAPPVDPAIKNSLQQEVIEKGLGKLHSELSEKDPVWAKRVHPNDQYRILRALELVRSGVKPSELRESFEGSSGHPGYLLGYPITVIGLRRKKEILKSVIETRTAGMLGKGLIEETESLIRDYPNPRPRPLDSVGYKEVASFLEGKISREAIGPEIVKNTLALVKRQSTWFKRDTQIRWFDPDEEAPLLGDFLRATFTLNVLDS